MTTLPTIKTAREFEAMMVAIWDGELHHRFYNQWHHARKAAEAVGMVRLWGARIDGEPGYTYECADGSRVNITSNGNSLHVVNRHTR